MEIKKRTETISSLINDLEQDVLLTITFGNAQIGGNIITWDGDETIIKKGKVTNLNLGKGSVIKGKTLKIESNILDVNTQTNGVVVTYYFNNATESAKTFDDKVDNHGDIFSLTLYVNF
jgi:hypothetical protein